MLLRVRQEAAIELIPTPQFRSYLDRLTRSANRQTAAPRCHTLVSSDRSSGKESERLSVDVVRRYTTVLGLCKVSPFCPWSHGSPTRLVQMTDWPVCQANSGCE
jgi:hypothetical protein